LSGSIDKASGSAGGYLLTIGVRFNRPRDFDNGSLPEASMKQSLSKRHPAKKRRSNILDFSQILSGL